jgi:hypothetical protein
MENTTDTKLPASPPLPAPIGSATGREYLRLVLQMPDTAENRVAMDGAHKAIKAVPMPVCGKLILKRETIHIVSMESTQPNDAGQWRAAPDLRMQTDTLSARPLHQSG